MLVRLVPVRPVPQARPIHPAAPVLRAPPGIWQCSGTNGSTHTKRCAPCCPIRTAPWDQYPAGRCRPGPAKTPGVCRRRQLVIFVFHKGDLRSKVTHDFPQKAGGFLDFRRVFLYAHHHVAPPGIQVDFLGVPAHHGGATLRRSNVDHRAVKRRFPFCSDGHRRRGPQCLGADFTVHRSRVGYRRHRFRGRRSRGFGRFFHRFRNRRFTIIIGLIFAAYLF